MKHATSNYLKRAAEAAQVGFSTSEEKESCLENVFAELEEDALHICQCAETSVIVEQFVAMATSENLNILYEALKADINTVLKDRFASHVLQSILLRSTKFVTKAEDIKDEKGEDCLDQTNDSENRATSLEDMIFHLSDAIVEDIGSFLMDSYSSHVVRALLQVLGGTSVEFKITRPKKGSKKEQQGPRFSDYAVPDSFRKQLKQIGKHIFDLQHLNVLLLDTHASAVVQTLLLVCHKMDGDLCGKYIKKIIKLAKISDDNVSSTTNLPPVTTDKVGSFLVQQIMTLASADVYTKLFTKLFKGSMLLYAIHPKANFVLQSLLGSCTEKEIFKEQFEELEDKFEDVMAYGHYGVINAIAKTCQKLECKQKHFKQSLMSALHCRDPQGRQKKLFPTALTMRTYEVYYDLPDDQEAEEGQKKPEVVEETPNVPLDETSINYFGSLLLQEMLRFTGTKLVVESLLDMTSADLSTVSCNSFGSYVLETFFQSKTVAKTAKDSLIDIWKGQCIEVACNRIGCQTIQSLWKHFTLAQKSSVAEELCKDEIKVRSDQYGKYVYSTFALQHFKKRPKDWEFIQQQEVKKRKLFVEMTGKEMPHKRHKKSRQDQDSVQEGLTYGENMQLETTEDLLQDDHMGYRGKGQDGHPFRGRGRGYGHSRGSSRGRGDGHFRGGSRGRGRGDGQFRGRSRGRGDGQFRGGSRGRGRGDQFRGGARGRGDKFDRRGSKDDRTKDYLESSASKQHFKGGPDRGNFRGNDKFRGRGPKGNRTDVQKNFSDNFGKDSEKGKSESFGIHGKKKGGHTIP